MRPEDLKQQRILFGCLNWGSGHVARSISLIRQLVDQGNMVFLLCNKEQQAVFEQYVNRVTFISEEGFQFRFRGDGNFFREMSRNAWGFRNAVRAEKRTTSRLVSELNIECIVSDHRYGLYSRRIPSYFVTHQVFLPPKSGRLAQVIHRKWMKHFSGIWIMDRSENRLAGILSSPIENSIYIGFRSRFSASTTEKVAGRIVAIVSGPEPYAEQLFHEAVELMNEKDGERFIVAPRIYADIDPSITVLNSWKASDSVIAGAETIISRNGYSTLMDLEILGTPNRILIPTPGQLEQEYLAVICKL